MQGKKQKQKTQDRGVCPQHYIKAASDSMQCADCEGAPPHHHVLLSALSVQRSKGALSPPRNASTALGRAAQRAVPGISSCVWTHPDHVLPVGPSPSALTSPQQLDLPSRSAAHSSNMSSPQGSEKLALAFHC